MPHVVEVRCPGCSERATFEFAELVQIKLRDDIAYFQASPQFEYAFLSDHAGRRWHGAFYFQGLHGSPSAALSDLPTGYSPADWEHSQYLDRRGGHDKGSISCSGCGLQRRHELAWPGDAFYQLDYRGAVLWAFHRESALELRDFVGSTQRKHSDYRWEGFLLHVPSQFLTAKARGAVVKGLDRLLKS